MPQILSTKSLSYNDITLIPSRHTCILESRSLADTRINFCGHLFNLPVIPANMSDIMTLNLAKDLADYDYLYIMHRFNNTTVSFVEGINYLNKRYRIVSISTGVNEDSIKELEKISHISNLDFITVDVAHGHHIKVEKMIKWIKNHFRFTKVIAGNIATIEGYNFLAECGADAVKCGIGGGSICTTKLETGFHIPMFSCIYDIANSSYRRNWVPIISDGGIQHPGDIAKALVAGADMVMAGSIFAECVDSAAAIASLSGISIKYSGSTSYANKQVHKHIEGRSIILNKSQDSVLVRMEKLKQSLQSSISYAGGKDLTCFRNVEWRIIK